MREVRKSTLVRYSREQMFALVDDVERYPEFLPWCAGSSVEHRDERVVRATIRIAYRGIRQSFSTENTLCRPERLDLNLLSGPFRSLHGAWHFADLDGKGSRIDFHLSYEFSSRLLEALIGPVFDHITNTLVDAFVRRAESTLGQAG